MGRFPDRIAEQLDESGRAVRGWLEQIERQISGLLPDSGEQSPRDS